MDHIRQIRISAKGLAEGKNPPICDSCNDSIEPNTRLCPNHLEVEISQLDSLKRKWYCPKCQLEWWAMEARECLLNCLILHWYQFRKFLCDKCVEKYFSKLPKMKEEDAPKVERMAVWAVMGQELRVT